MAQVIEEFYPATTAAGEIGQNSTVVSKLREDLASSKSVVG